MKNRNGISSKLIIIAFAAIIVIFGLYIIKSGSAANTPESNVTVSSSSDGVSSNEDAITSTPDSSAPASNSDGPQSENGSGSSEQVSHSPDSVSSDSVISEQQTPVDSKMPWETRNLAEPDFTIFKTAEEMIASGVKGYTIMDIGSVFGEWNYEMIVKSSSLTYSETGRCNISAGQNRNSLDLTAKYGKDESEMWIINKTEVSYDTFTGIIENGILAVQSDYGIIVIDTVVTDGEHQYAFGALSSSNGYLCDFILTR